MSSHSAYHHPMEYCHPFLPPSHGILSPSAYYCPMEYCPPLLTTVPWNTVPLCFLPSRRIPSFPSTGEQWSFPDVPGRSIPVKRPPCKTLGVVVSALRLVGRVSVHCEIPILMCSFHLTERQHVRHSKQIHSWACSWDVKAPTNQPNQPPTNQPTNQPFGIHAYHTLHSQAITTTAANQSAACWLPGQRESGDQTSSEEAGAP